MLFFILNKYVQCGIAVNKDFIFKAFLKWKHFPMFSLVLCEKILEIGVDHS